MPLLHRNIPSTRTGIANHHLKQVQPDHEFLSQRGTRIQSITIEQVRKEVQGVDNQDRFHYLQGYDEAQYQEGQGNPPSKQ